MKKLLIGVVSCVCAAAVAVASLCVIDLINYKQNLADNFENTSHVKYYQVEGFATKENLEGYLDELKKTDKKAYVNDECIITTYTKEEAQLAAEQLGCELVAWSSETGNALLNTGERSLTQVLEDACSSEEFPEIPLPAANYIFTILEDSEASGELRAEAAGDYSSVNDPLYSEKYDITLEKANWAWSGATGKNVLVAVIDTGVDYDHPDLVNKISPESVYINDTNVSKDPNDYNDLNSHGTHVCGIIAAKGNNGEGIIGVAPDAQIMAIKATSDADGSGFTEYNLCEALHYAADNGARVINMSLGISYSSGGYLTKLEAAVDYAAGKGCIILAASGNEKDSHANYPAAYSNVIAISAVNSAGAFDTSYSNYGPEVEFAAAGTYVLSTVPGGGYSTKRGTSMASPQAAGAVALILEKHPTYTLSDVRSILSKYSLDSGDVGFDQYYGNGLIQLDFLAQRYTEGDYEYAVSPANTVKIFKYNGNGKSVEVPYKINNMIVTEIANYAFEGHSEIEAIELSSALRLVNRSAFTGCTNLKKLTVKSLTPVISEGAFDSFNGLTVICSKDSNLSAYCESHGVEYYYYDEPVTTLEFSEKPQYLTYGENYTLEIIKQPAGAYCEYTVTSSNEDAVKVLNNGKLSAVSKGTSVITLTDGSFTDSFTTEVIVPPTTVELDNHDITVKALESFKLSAYVHPEDTTEVVTWSSSNDDVARVDNDGNVTALRPGAAVITANIASIADQCNVTVVTNIESIGFENETIEVGKDERKAFHLNIYPSNGVGDIVWKSSNPEVVTVDNDGTYYTRGHGTAVITAEIGDLKAECTINCVPKLDFDLMGVSVRLYSPYGIRYGVKLAKNHEYQMTDIVEFGTLMIPEDMLESHDELTLENTDAKKIRASNIFSQTSEYLVYTGVLVNIPSNSFNTNVVGRGYLIYRDVDGSKHVIYTDTATSSYKYVVDYVYNDLVILEQLDNAQEDMMLALNKIREMIYL